MEYADRMVNALGIIAGLFILVLAAVAPTFFALGCMAVALVYAVNKTREKRRR